MCSIPDTFDDDLNSSGTDDLDIHPEGDQFEEPNLGRYILTRLWFCMVN